jgi:small-conductance mechanosensitive channel
MDGLSDGLLAWWAALALPFLASLLPALLKAALVIAITLVVGRRANLMVRGAAVRGSVDAGTTLLVARLIHLTILSIGTVVVLDILGVPLATLIAAIGVIGLAVSLALQDLLRNFFSGVYLLFERPFQLGDRIRVRDNEGVVEYVGFRTLRLRADDGVEILIPSSLVVADVVANRGRRPEGDAAEGAERKQAAI